MATVEEQVRNEAEWERRLISGLRDTYLQTDVMAKIKTDPAYAKKVQTISELLGPATDAKILDIGCNTAGESTFLQNAGHDVVAGDVNEVALAVAKERNERFNWRSPAFVCFDAHRLPFRDGAFDAVIAWEVLHHLADLPTALAEIQRVLKPGGRAVAYEPYALNPYRRFSEFRHRFVSDGQGIERSFTEGQIRRTLIDAGFRVDEIVHVPVGLSNWKASRYSAPKRIVAQFLYYRAMERAPRLLAPMVITFEKPAAIAA